MAVSLNSGFDAAKRATPADAPRDVAALHARRADASLHAAPA